jgi:hypothetical protein
MGSFVISLWDGHHNVAAISTGDKAFVEKLKKWAERQGLRVEFDKAGETKPKSK